MSHSSRSPKHPYTLEAALELARIGRDAQDMERLERWNAVADELRAARAQPVGPAVAD